MEDYRLDIHDIKDSYNHILEFIEKSKWKAEKSISFLKHLFEQTEQIVFIEKKEINQARFSPQQLTDETDDSGYPAKYANRYKTAFDDFITQNKDELIEYLASKNVTFLISIQTRPIGRKVEYFLAVVPLNFEKPYSSNSDYIEYNVVELPEPKWWVKPFVKLDFDGWKKWLFLAAPFLLFIFIVSGFYYYIKLTPAPIYLGFYLLSIFFFSLVYCIAKPFYLTLDNSIAIVSDWMLRVSQRSGQVEMHYLDEKDDAGYPLRELRLSIYSAKCPICDGAVFIDNGKHQYKGRLVGKCRKAQTEHVFSFDHITKKGKFIN